MHFVLKQSSLWRTVHWTVLVAAELRAKRIDPTPPSKSFPVDGGGKGMSRRTTLWIS